MNLKEIRPYLKPLFVGFCFFILLCGYQTTQNFQSGINEENGYISVALIHGFLAIGQLFAPAIVQFLTPKFSMVVAGLCYVFYIATNIKLIIPLYFVSSAVCGFGASLLWSANSTLLSGYEQHCKSPSFVYTLFYVPTYFNFIGNIIPMIFTPENPKWLFLALTVIALVAVILFCFSYNSPPTKIENVNELMLSTCKYLVNWRLALFFPLALLFGFSRSFYYTSMPVLAPINMTSWIFISMGITMTISTFFWGWLNKLFSEKIVIVIPLIAEAIACIFGFIINEHFLNNTTVVPEDNVYLKIMVCLLGAVAGIGDSGFESITVAMINRIWPKEVAPMCAWRIIYLSVMCIALIYSAYVDCRIVLIIFGVAVVLATLFLFIIVVSYKKVYLQLEKDNNQRVKNEKLLEENDEEEKLIRHNDIPIEETSAVIAENPHSTTSSENDHIIRVDDDSEK